MIRKSSHEEALHDGTVPSQLIHAPDTMAPFDIQQTAINS
jgi:hypothetical protein